MKTLNEYVEASVNEEVKAGIVLSTQKEIDGFEKELILKEKWVSNIQTAAAWKARVVFELVQAVAGWNSALKAFNSNRALRLDDLQDELKDFFDASYESLKKNALSWSLSGLDKNDLSLFIKYAKPMHDARMKIASFKAAKFES